MRTTILLLVLLAAPAWASEEQIHSWKTVTLVADTAFFGDVEVKASADAKGNVTTLAVTAKGTTITAPAKWLATLPALRLASIEVRTERGYDPQPWLYVVFQVGFSKDRVHVSIQDGRIKSAMITSVQPDGTTKHEHRKAP